MPAAIEIFDDIIKRKKRISIAGCRAVPVQSVQVCYNIIDNIVKKERYI
ncbi:hypothetical protein HMPREF3033_00182 [Veillonellaceae bacterium DNF00751]|nr:hypothetical protein HMPREF3033_00182 [Veillonellaceae bacterium DNF00751]